MDRTRRRESDPKLIVTYYVEGDRGHLMDERAYQRKAALNVRGNAYSFPMPWEGIAAKLEQIIDGQVPWDQLPHNQHILAKTVLFNLRIGNVCYGLTLPSDRALLVSA